MNVIPVIGVDDIVGVLGVPSISPLIPSDFSGPVLQSFHRQKRLQSGAFR